MVTERNAGPIFSLETALAHRDRGEFPAWLDAFLRGPGVNVPLADGLLRDRRWWFGPEELELATLVRKCGPGLEYHEDEAIWDRRVNELASKIDAGLAVPPLVAEYRGGSLSLADGNHRAEALRRSGHHVYWTAVWFNSEGDYLEFLSGSVERMD